MRTVGIGIATLLLLAGCGNTSTERMLTGGATGATAGAVVGGPVGLVVGGLGGAATGAMMNQSATDYVNADFADRQIAEVKRDVNNAAH